jgi:hypothetical protein
MNSKWRMTVWVILIEETLQELIASLEQFVNHLRRGRSTDA